MGLQHREGRAKHLPREAQTSFSRLAREMVSTEQVSKTNTAKWEEVRKIALSLPGAEEGLCYGTPGFRVGGKLFARFHQDQESLVLYVEYSAREVLIGVKPDVFYLTDHYRCYPWMLVRISKVRLKELRELIVAAWRLRAPKRLTPWAGNQEQWLNEISTVVGTGRRLAQKLPIRPRASRPRLQDI